MNKIISYVSGMMADPDGSGSSTRWCGVICILTACGCAIAGIVRRDPNAVGIVGAIGAVGTGCLFARKKSPDTAAQ